MEFSEDKMSESHLILLLQLIYAGADVDALLRRGLQFSQIAGLIEQVVNNRFVEEIDGNLKLTELGLEKLRAGKKYYSSRTVWISPLDEFRIEKIGNDDIFLPCLSSVNEIARSLALRGQPRE